MTGNERATVTFFQSAFAKQKWQRELTLPDLADLIRNTSRSSKDQLPWLKLARFGNARTPKGSYRHDRNVIAITGCEADYDGELVPFDDAVDVAAKADLRALLYTSPSHIPERPRWRIIAPTSREYPPVERARWLARINGLYGGIFERESWTLSQSYYFGSINRAASHLVEILDGEAIDRLDDLDLIAIGPAAATTTRAVAALDGSEARDDAELVRRIVTGEGFHTELCALAARYVGRGLQAEAVAATLRGLMLAHPDGARDLRWQDRFASVTQIVASARQKFAPEAERRRRIARLTHRLIRQRRSGADIRAAILAEAERTGLDESCAIEIGAAILREAAGPRHAR